MNAVIVKLLRYLLIFVIGLVLSLWPLLMLFGLISVAIDDPKLLLMMLGSALAVAGVVWGIGLLLSHEKTARIAKPIFGTLLVVFLVKACMLEGGSSGCTPTRYIACDH